MASRMKTFRYVFNTISSQIIYIEVKIGDKAEKRQQHLINKLFSRTKAGDLGIYLIFFTIN